MPPATLIFLMVTASSGHASLSVSDKERLCYGYMLKCMVKISGTVFCGKVAPPIMFLEDSCYLG